MCTEYTQSLFFLKDIQSSPLLYSPDGLVAWGALSAVFFFIAGFPYDAVSLMSLVCINMRTVIGMQLFAESKMNHLLVVKAPAGALGQKTKPLLISTTHGATLDLQPKSSCLWPVKSTLAILSAQRFCKCHYPLHCCYMVISDLNQITHYYFALKCGTKGIHLSFIYQILLSNQFTF